MVIKLKVFRYYQPVWHNTKVIQGKHFIAVFPYTAKSYADALNTVTPSANGSVGLVPAYGLFDINTSYHVNPKMVVRFNINNVFNKQYFTEAANNVSRAGHMVFRWEWVLL